jgi:anti-sigma regulatory factor (Ser/Thr protein kinase)
VGVGAARCYPPDPAVLAAARSFAADRLHALELTELRDDVQLLLTELMTNVIIHARTDFEVRMEPTGDGVRVEVMDGNAAMPVPGTLAANALTGRGLTLVQSLSARWGAHPNEDGGKTVWFEVAPRPVESSPVTDLDALLGMWDERPHDQGTSGSDPLVEVVIPDLPVQQLLAAKAHMEDLLREVQLVLLADDRRSHEIPEWSTLVNIARRLDATAEEFAEGRRQVRFQALEAASRGEELVTLRLQLPPESAGAAARYGEAVRRAEELGAAGNLLVTAEHISEYTDIRRRYLNAVIDQLTAHRR